MKPLDANEQLFYLKYKKSYYFKANFNFLTSKFQLFNKKYLKILSHSDIIYTISNLKIVIKGGIFMKCPFCSYEESKVIDSRPTDEGERIRRRRECLNCKKRFTTYEIIESLPIIVIKKDKSREVFNRDKLLNGLLRACEKRPVSLDSLDKMIDDIESNLQNSLDREISSEKIGELVMDKLKDIDEVAYVRFASVYRQFKDIGTFMNELNKLLSTK